MLDLLSMLRQRLCTMDPQSEVARVSSGYLCKER